MSPPSSPPTLPQTPLGQRPGKGVFVSFEGIDGAGKSTHIQRLVELWRRQGREVVLTREPGGTPLAERLRELLLHEKMDSLSEALLMFASRREHVVECIAPALRRGAVVVSDRFADSSFAYQGGGRGFDANILRQLEQWALCVTEPSQAPWMAHPDLTLWFDIPATVAAQRLSASRAPDKFESESTFFFERVAQAYQDRVSEHPDRCVRIEADQPLEGVWLQVVNALRQRRWVE